MKASVPISLSAPSPRVIPISPSQSGASSNGSNPATANEPSPTTSEDFDSFLSETETFRPSGCAVCDNPKVSNLFDRWLERKIDGTTEAPANAVLKFAGLHYDFKRSLATVYRHLSHCREENYKKVRSR